MTSQQNWFEANPKKTLTYIIIIGFLLIDFSLAAALKIVGAFKPSYVTSSVREAYYRNVNPIYHHDLKKNINNYIAEWGNHDYRIDTNSLGFKDSSNRKISLNPAKGQKRLLLIGDSFTEGMGIPFNKTFAGLLHQNLQVQNIDVLNAAVSSYSPIIYYRKIKYLIETIGLKFDSVIVFIDLSDAEDEALGYRFDENENVVSQGSAANLGAADSEANSAQTTSSKENIDKTSPSNSMTMKDFFTQYTYFLGRLRNLSAYLKTKKRSWKDGLKQRRAMWALDSSLYKEFGEKGLQLGSKNMLKLKLLLDKHNIPLTIAVYPWPDQIYNQDMNSKQLTYWENWSVQNKVHFINLFKTFKPTISAERTIKDFYIKGDVHWNQLGHQRVFETVKANLNGKI